MRLGHCRRMSLCWRREWRTPPTMDIPHSHSSSGGKGKKRISIVVGEVWGWNDVRRLLTVANEGGQMLGWG